MNQFLQFKTSFEEVESCIHLFDKLDNIPYEVINGSFSQELRSFMMDKYGREGTSIRFYSSLDPDNQGIICCYLGYGERYFEVYRTHSFLKTIACWYASYRSDEIFGYHKEDFDSYHVLKFYKSLTNEEKRKLIEFGNIISSEK